MSVSNYRTDHAAKRKARRFVLQNIYEWLVRQAFENDKASLMHQIVAHTRAINAMHKVDLGYYHALCQHIVIEFDALCSAIEPYLDRPFVRLGLVERSTLLIGAYELIHSVHIPYKVVIDEAVQLNVHFGAQGGHKLINAVLDKLARQVRMQEIVSDSMHGSGGAHGVDEGIDEAKV